MITFDVDSVDTSVPIAVRVNNEGGFAVGIAGSCSRNPITGVVNLQQAFSMTDFVVVDLFERHRITGHPTELAEDPYLFKIYPLASRTWMYHTYFGKPQILSRSVGNDGIMVKVLNDNTVDVPQRTGRWSSFCTLIPAALLSCMTADLLTVAITTSMAVFSLFSSVYCNDPEYFQLVRPITVVPRLAFMIFVIIRMAMGGSEASEGPLALVGFFAVIVCCIIDHCMGDFFALNSISFLCQYKMVRTLPNRVFICKREGAAFQEEKFGDRGEVSQVVTGMSWEDGMTLIAEIKGLVVELRPMTRDDWLLAWQERANSGSPISFIGLDIFNSTIRSYGHLQLSEAKKSAAGAADALKHMIESEDSPFKRNNTAKSLFQFSKAKDIS